MKFKTHSYTVKGKRVENQDNVLIVEKDEIILASVADGMGGHVGGAKASELVNKTIKDLFLRTKFPDTKHQTMVD
jgi:protein phosphatase